MSHYRREPAFRRHDYERHPVRQRSRSPARSRSHSGSRSPDPELQRFLAEQARPASPTSEEHRRQRIAAGGIFNVKSRHERERDEAERKRREEEEDAAKAYRDFVADMEGAEGSRGSYEDRGERRGCAAAGSGSSRGFVQAGGSAYVPPSRSQQVQSAPVVPKAAMRTSASASSAFAQEEDVQDQEQNVKRELPGKKSGAMQSFLGELQRNQARREERLRDHVTESSSMSSILAQEMKPAQAKPRDELDSASSNICVLNLPANVSEPSFAEYFSQYGDVASVKIMWPRVEDTVPLPSSIRTTRHSGATGFINFMRRSDAQVAYKEMDGTMWGGSEIHTAWGKSLPKPSFPIFLRSTFDRQHGRSARSDERAPRHRKRRSSRSPGSRHHRRNRPDEQSSQSVLRSIILEREGGHDLDKTIAAVASRVREYGSRFEGIIREREGANPKYAFLEPSDSPEHQYYRCLLDNGYLPIVPASAFTEEGDQSLYSSDTEEDSEWEKSRSLNRLGELGKAARLRLDAMLRGITLRRERIARIMVFAIDHAQAAEAVTDRLISSVLIPTTPLPRKLARLYAISDILHNSTASGAWRYRSLFESRLDACFAHWGDVANSFAGRIKREACKDMARAVLSIWETWLVFETLRLSRWRNLIDWGSGVSTAEREPAILTQRDLVNGSGVSSTEKRKSESLSKMDGGHIKGAGVDGEDVDGEDIDGEDIDGQDIGDGDMHEKALSENKGDDGIDGEAINTSEAPDEAEFRKA